MTDLEEHNFLLDMGYFFNTENQTQVTQFNTHNITVKKHPSCLQLSANETWVENCKTLKKN